MLEGGDRPLNVKFAEEQQTKRDKRDNRRFSPGKIYRDMEADMSPLMGSPLMGSPYSSLPMSMMGSPRPPMGYGPGGGGRGIGGGGGAIRYSQYPMLGGPGDESWMNQGYGNNRGQLLQQQMSPGQMSAQMVSQLVGQLGQMQISPPPYPAYLTSPPQYSSQRRGGNNMYMNAPQSLSLGGGGEYPAYREIVTIRVME
jgi:hypothetical protein